MEFRLSTPVLLLVFVFMFSACDQEPSITESPAAYNDTLVAIFEPVQESYTSLVDGIYGEEQADLDQLLNTFKEQSEAARENLDNLPKFEGDTSFYNAAQRLSEFYVESASEDYNNIVEIVKKDQTTVEEERFLDNFMLSTLQKEKARFSDFITAQEKFAEKHQVQLVSEE